MFDGPLFQKRCFKDLQFSFKKMIAPHFMCIIKWHIAMILPLMKTSNENAFPYKFLKIFKRPSFHCQKFLDLNLCAKVVIYTNF